MEVIAINGSPRKNANTATLCKKFLEGAASAGETVNTTLVNLYDLDYKGCISCFGCKRIKGDTYGKCIVKDDLHELLQKVSTADAVAFASPIYFGEVTGQLRSFLERLLFPFFTYEANYKKIAPKRMPVTMLYTMNVTEQIVKDWQYDKYFDKLEALIGGIFTPPQRICAYNTYQFKNYSDYKVEIFSEPDKAAHREKQFPIDCQNAFNAGKKIVESLK